jgi:hypothetical protein
MDFSGMIYQERRISRLTRRWLDASITGSTRETGGIHEPGLEI